MGLRRRKRDREQAGFRYSAWDGTQRGFDLDADALLDEMTDDLLYHGDLHAALRRLMQQGMKDRDGEQMMGLRDMLEKLREQRREMLERYDLGGVYEEIAEQLREVVDVHCLTFAGDPDPPPAAAMYRKLLLSCHRDQT